VIARCERPLEWGVLIDYWFGEAIAPDDASRNERVEEHLLCCGSCSQRLQDLVALGDGVRRLAREGAIAMVVTRSFLEWAAREGLRVREYRVQPGGRAACTIRPEDDLLVGRLQGRFSGASRLDVVWHLENGSEHRIDDLPFSPDADEVILAQKTSEMRMIGAETWTVRLIARDAGGERLVGEYTFAHSPHRL